MALFLLGSEGGSLVDGSAAFQVEGYTLLPGGRSAPLAGPVKKVAKSMLHITHTHTNHK